MANDPFLIIRKPTTPLGWTISSVAVTTVIGIVFASWQAIRSDVQDIKVNGAIQNERWLFVCQRLERLEKAADDAHGAKVAAHTREPKQ